MTSPFAVVRIKSYFRL